MEKLKDSTSDNCSDNVVYCKNTDAIKAGRYFKKLPTIKCEFCGKELEKVGYYFREGTLLKEWRTFGANEKCDCKEATEYLKEVEKQEKARIIKEAEEEAKRKYEEKVNRLIKGSNLGERFKSRTFETYKVDKNNQYAFGTCKKYAEQFKDLKNKGIGLSLVGNYGTGKTHLAAAITHKIIYQGYQPIFGTLISLLGKVKASYSDPYAKENEDTIINKYINCDLLIIDDLGKEKPSEWILEKLYYIINCRYENLKPIIITSNYNNDKLVERLTVNNNLETPEAIVSRLCEMSQGVNLNNCEDYRKKDLF